jgi:hypothetical protein
VPDRTHEEGKSGEVEDVAQMMRDALDIAISSLFSFVSCNGVFAIHWKDTAGKRGSMRCLSDWTRWLRERLMMVHLWMEGKDLRWRLR